MSRYPQQQAGYPPSNGGPAHETHMLRQQCQYLESQVRELQLMSKSQAAILRTNLNRKLEERDGLVGRACRALAQFDSAAAGQLHDELQRLRDVGTIQSSAAVAQLQQEVEFLRAQNAKLQSQVDQQPRPEDDPEGRILALETDKRELMSLLQKTRDKLEANLTAAAMPPPPPGAAGADGELAAAQSEIARLQQIIDGMAAAPSTGPSTGAEAAAAEESHAQQIAQVEAKAQESQQRLSAELAELQEAITHEQVAHASSRDEHLQAIDEARKAGDAALAEHKAKEEQLLQAMEQEVQTMINESKAGFEAEKATMTKQIKRLRKQSSNTAKAVVPVKRSLKALKATSAALREDTAMLLTAMPQLTQETSVAIQAAVQRQVQSVADLAVNYRRELAERKRLFNLVQELRGNIRVFCRVRPPTAQERARGGEHMGGVCVGFPEEGSIRVTNDRAKEKTWEFDQVFAYNTDQQTVYDQVSPLVTSVLDGFNVCIFAYGQTGSGKTYTMMGPADNRGVNTRTLDELFVKSQARANEVRDTISVAIFEIYCEQIRDMLGDDVGGQKFEIRKGERGNFVPGMTWVPVATMAEVLELLALADQNRSTAATNMNEHSSRSHLILSVQVESVNLVSQQRTWGKLHLVDLAGSERISKSGAEGQALKEAQAINKSLSALGDVIMSRAQKTSHVPFRNSTLTHLLQDSLSGDSKTLMFVCCSPVMFNAEETFCSLNFAARVRTVELGKAQRNVGGSGGGAARSRRAASGH